MWAKIILGISFPILRTLEVVAALIALGILVEVAFRRLRSNIPSPPLWNRVFNCKCVAVIVVFQGSVEMLLFLPVVFFAVKIVALLHGPLFAPRPGITFALLVTLLASLIGDFVYYWVHRLEHCCGWLWPIHKLHHEDEHMNVTTALRFHWLESMAEHTAQVVPAAFLPQPLVTIPLLYFLRYARVTFEHLAIPLYLGRVVASPANHRIHHSKLPEHIDKNFAAVWPFWDVIFGTYCAPRPGEYPPTGLLFGKASKSLRDAFFTRPEVAEHLVPAIDCEGCSALDRGSVELD